FLERLHPEIVIQRLCGDAKPGTLIAPQWNLTKNEILAGIRDELARRGTYQGFFVE
ncbi:MAG: TIGR01212 family radical SAM protein, partial [Bacteroidales bacterium]|nr:TIGR01212 family radical SAM protein [Bacteroidales bacterium]